MRLRRANDEYELICSQCGGWNKYALTAKAEEFANPCPHCGKDPRDPEAMRKLRKLGWADEDKERTRTKNPKPDHKP